MNENLKPCPFCGAEALLTEHEPHDHSPALVALTGIPDKFPGSWTIECVVCSCGMIHATCDDVVSAWNRRASSALATEGGEARTSNACRCGVCAECNWARSHEPLEDAAPQSQVDSGEQKAHAIDCEYIKSDHPFAPCTCGYGGPNDAPQSQVAYGLRKQQCNEIMYFIEQSRKASSAEYIDMLDTFRDWVNSLVVETTPAQSIADTAGAKYQEQSQAPRGVIALRHLIECLRETGHYRDEEGEDVNALDDLCKLLEREDGPASDADEAAALRAFDKSKIDGFSHDLESYCAGYVDCLADTPASPVVDAAGAKPVYQQCIDPINMTWVDVSQGTYNSLGCNTRVLYENAIVAPPAPSVALCSICNGYGRWQDGHSGTEADGYAPNIVECECTDEERRPEYRQSAPSVADAAGAKDFRERFDVWRKEHMSDANLTERLMMRQAWTTAIEECLTEVHRVCGPLYARRIRQVMESGND